ncbi:NAD(+) synthase [Halosimplex aquaticum]|uniref:NH(3)-dependent NAD(+) synthetase n=1 Tax=Halosimplex aquaticum TaxID=3026162 RepID=A0ABD5XUD7_9EURY|nr:NAD(+) synthase [Halosimplex aquaticum]
MSDAARHPRILDLPRDEYGLATTRVALRRLQELLPEFLVDIVDNADADGLVVPLDGGVDAATAAALAVDAVGEENVLGLITPAGLTDEATASTAEAVAEMLGIEHRRLQLQPVLAAFQEVVGEAGGPADDLVATDNAVERFRTATAYYFANRRDALVVGPVDRTDRLLGAATKYGETGVDCFLFGDLYRTEVRALAEAMDLPVEMLDGAPRSAPHDPAPAATLDVGAETIDRALGLSVDEGRGATETADRLGIDRSVVVRLADWCAATRHKRHQPPKPSTNR